ncbi:hypothetical protein C8R46DRAFT_1112565 [Mycena filopes]|nr:hypothetical protein C8R46DRAFT_1112565 [Mycena filopes]
MGGFGGASTMIWILFAPRSDFSSPVLCSASSRSSCTFYMQTLTLYQPCSFILSARRKGNSVFNTYKSTCTLQAVLRGTVEILTWCVIYFSSQPAA